MRYQTVVCLLLVFSLFASPAYASEGGGVALGRQGVEEPAEREFSPVGAFALEFFIGFGAGHYYQGRNGWGAVGTVSSVVGLTGVGLWIAAVAKCGDFLGGCLPHRDLMISGLVLGGVGGVGHVASAIAAPVLTINHNEAVRRRRAEAPPPVSEFNRFPEGAPAVLGQTPRALLVPLWAGRF